MHPKIDYDYLNQPVKLFGSIPSNSLYLFLFGFLGFIGLNIVVIFLSIFIFWGSAYLVWEFSKKRISANRLYYLFRALFKNKRYKNNGGIRKNNGNN